MTRLAELEQRNPEWRPWLAAVGQVLAELEERDWHAAVPQQLLATGRTTPRLAGASAPVERGTVARFVGAVMPYFAADPMALFRAALNGDESGLAALADEAETDAHAFRAGAALLPMPFLHACARRWVAAIPRDWAPGYCPLCGHWPTLAELCGVERARYLRCASCGSAWPVHVLTCPFCGLTDHTQLAALVPEKSAPNASIETCNRCRGYVKVLTRLRPGEPARVMLDDLATVELDLAAAQRGLRRPEGRGHALGIELPANG